MGQGAYQSTRESGIQPVVTETTSIEEAVLAYVEGRIVDQADRLRVCKYCLISRMFGIEV